MNRKSLDEMVNDYINRGGKIKKIVVDQNNHSLIEGDTNDMCYHKREYLPPSFVSPDFLLKEDVKALV